jgi:hypothetical protein
MSKTRHSWQSAWPQPLQTTTASLFSQTSQILPSVTVIMKTFLDGILKNPLALLGAGLRFNLAGTAFWAQKRF